MNVIISICMCIECAYTGVYDKNIRHVHNVYGMGTQDSV